MKDFIVCILMTTGIFMAVRGAWEVGVMRSPCTIVRDGKEIIYDGKSLFYRMASLGSATIYQEYEPTFWLPRQVKEVVSNDFTVETVSCN